MVAHHKRLPPNNPLLSQQLNKLKLSDQALLGSEDLYFDQEELEKHRVHTLTGNLLGASIVDGYEMDDAMAGLQSES